MAWTFPLAILRAYRKAAEVAVITEARALLAEAKPITPREEGPLEGSGEVLGPEWSGDVVTAYVGFGGTPETEPYAVIQHERTDYQHEPGRQAKYLEAPANRRLTGQSERAAAVMAKEVGDA